MEAVRAFGRSMIALIGVAALAFLCSPAWAGDVSWMQVKVSSAVNHRNVAVIAEYKPGAKASIPKGARITAVYAMRSYKGGARVQTFVCWNGTSRCVEIVGASIDTHEFDGLDPRMPMYLVHRAPGDTRGPLPTPVFVKGTVIVSYEP